MLTLLNTFNMAQKLFLFCLFALHSVSLSNIVQYPAVVKAVRGETVSMTCNTVEILSRCDLVYWYKVQPRTREMILTTAVHTDPSLKLCRGFIYNTSVADSGIYYCSVKHSVIYYTGNGTTVIITEPRPGPVVTLYVPDVSVGPSVSLQCVVMGVVPSEAIVSWVVGDSEITGWTESGWTHANASAVEYTRAHISIPSETWLEAPNVECVVEVDGRRVSKSFKKGSSQLCSWLMYLCAGVALVILTVFIVTLVSLQTAGQCRVRTRSTESRFNQRSGGKRRTDTAKRSSITEVQYASLDLISNGQRGRTMLNRNVLLNE
ncbi:uncharacterized protein LOC128616205 isoform X1 [Ictalurus furcatus]|uniref:uncharacterized protein LOC128616205 isoform X1 n=2 Tax=Ictalurus furcatus TaxID=66913 RepID=UPI002350C26D|nr:uncharacterized protein LOC128616205 isoform X1 [Ictalurus furcatus]